MKKGFTLIELLVVIAIIGILSAIGLISLNGAREKARDAQAKSDLGQMRTALTLFADDNGGEYPAQAGALAANCVNADISDIAAENVTETGIWVNGDDIITDYLSSPLISPSSRSYNYCANETGANATASEYVLFYNLETGDGTYYYMLFADGDVVDYDDEATPPSCGAVADAPCAVT